MGLKKTSAKVILALVVNLKGAFDTMVLSKPQSCRAQRRLFESVIDFFLNFKKEMVRESFAAHLEFFLILSARLT